MKSINETPFLSTSTRRRRRNLRSRLLHAETLEPRCMLAIVLTDHALAEVDYSDSISENGQTTLTLYTLIDFYLVGTLTVNWGDPLSPNDDETYSISGEQPTYSISHQYLDDNPTGTGSDPYSITLGIELVQHVGIFVFGPFPDTATLPITVNNVAPTATLSASPASINEDDSVTVTGTITDAGTLDTHEVLIDWGGDEGTSPAVVTNGSFTATHQYAVTLPDGTAQADYTITATVTDDDTGEGTATTTVTVAHVAPEISNATATATDENGETTLTGSITDPSEDQSYTLVVDWGDPLSPTNIETFTFPPGTTTFSKTHKYLDDNPTNTASDDYTIGLTITDEQEGSSTGSATVTVNNVAPVVTELTANSPTIDEGGSVTVTGKYTDVGTKDTHTAVIDWGDGSPTSMVTGANGMFTATHSYTDDGASSTPQDVYTITATVSDDDTGSAALTTTVTVKNVVPVLATLNLSQAIINENGSVTVTGTFTDVGSADTHTVMIDWGPGEDPSLAVVTESTGSGSFTATLQYLDDNPTATPFDVYAITATVTDDDMGTASKTKNLTVQNVAPVLGSLVATTINENGVTTLTGTITDPGTADTFTLNVDWGDPLSPLNIETYTFPAGTTTFTKTHKYLDDNPSNSNSDKYTIGLTITDDDTGAMSSSTMVTVNNVAPVLANLLAPTIDENGQATLTGTITDPGTLDTFTLVVNWGDLFSPSNVVTYTLPAGTTSFSKTHRYLDDNPTGTPQDAYSIQATVTDDDTGAGSSSTTVTVRNVPPVLGGLLATTTNENGETSLFGTITDPSLEDTFTLDVNWGDPLSPNNVETFLFPAGTTSFVKTHRYLDDNPTSSPSNSYSIGLTIRDDDTGTTSRSTVVQVDNVAPTLAGLLATTLSENGATTLSGTIVDPSPLDSFTLTVNWGDPLSPQNVETFTFPAGTTFFSKTHQYLDDHPTNSSSDLYTINLTIADDDLESTTSSTTVRVNNIAPTLSNLVATPANENGLTTLTGTITDPSLLDSFTLTVNWGDPSSPQNVETFMFPAGTTTFSKTHTYLDDSPTNSASDQYSIGLTISDDDLGVSTGSTLVTVNNVAPALSNLLATPVNENGLTTLTGTITDSSALDSFTVIVNWGDPLSPQNVETFTFPAGTTTFSKTHKYLDDVPTSTPSDQYTIGLTITDDDTGTSSASTTVTVNNVAPVLANLLATPMNENGQTTLTGTITDPGTADTFTLTINWGDPASPQNVETFTFPAGTTTFSKTHKYLDDAPTSTPSDQFTIGLTITDDDTGTSSSSTAVIVNNVAPVLGSLQATTINETGTTTLTGTIIDPGTLDSFTLTINWGDPLSPQNVETFTFPAGTTTFSKTHQYLDDPSTGNTFLIGLTITDDDTGTSTGGATVTVNNLPPVLGNLAATAIDEGGVTTLTGTISDTGLLDAYTLTVFWNDSLVPQNVETVTLPPGTTTFSLTHQYLDDHPPSADTDPVTIYVSLTDDDGGTVTKTTKATVRNVPPVITTVSTSQANVGMSWVGQDFTVTGEFTDVGTWDWHTARIDWGDGFITAATITEANGVGTFTGSHRYASVGVYPIVVTVRDDEGASASTSIPGATICTTIVSNTLDSGAGSLRDAITCANGAPGKQTISFAIPGKGLKTIRPTTELPTITDPVVIDGYSQPTSVLNTLATSSKAVLRIELDGTYAGWGANGLRITGGGSTVRGLAINRFSGAGIELNTGGGNLITGNYIGTDVNGALDRGNGLDGVSIVNSPANTIGGVTAATRNVISGNDLNGVSVQGGAATGNVIQGNLIGTTRAGTKALRNQSNGISIDGASSNVVGGSNAANTLAFNGQNGVLVTGAAIKNSIVNNVMFSNFGLGIDLNGDGVTANDAGDADAGANNSQNAPVMTSIVLTGGSLAVSYSVPSVAGNSTYPLRVEFYRVDTANQEGKTYLGYHLYTVPGMNAFVPIPTGGAKSGARIVATATDMSGLGSTSEFSAAAVVTRALMAEAEAPASATAPATLTSAELQPVVNAAIARLAAQGLSGAQVRQLKSVSVSIADLPGATLGLAAANSITLDANAAGHGWYVDRTPYRDAEFAAKNRRTADAALAAQRIDLLTAVMHELGHTIGLEDLDPTVHPGDVMSATLGTGERHTSYAHVDAVFAAHGARGRK